MIRLDIDLPSEDEDEEAIIERRRKERAALVERVKLQTQDEDSQGSASRLNSPRDHPNDQQQREQSPDSDAVADEAVSFHLTYRTHIELFFV